MIIHPKKVRQRRNSQSARGYKLDWIDFKTFGSLNDPNVASPTTGRLMFEVPALQPYDILEIEGFLRYFQNSGSSKQMIYAIKNEDGTDLVSTQESGNVTTSANSYRSYFKVTFSPQSLSGNNFSRVDTDLIITYNGTIVVSRSGVVATNINIASVTTHLIGKSDSINFTALMQGMTRFYYEIYHATGGTTTTDYEVETISTKIYKPCFV